MIRTSPQDTAVCNRSFRYEIQFVFCGESPYHLGTYMSETITAYHVIQFINAFSASLLHGLVSKRPGPALERVFFSRSSPLPPDLGCWQGSGYGTLYVPHTAGHDPTRSLRGCSQDTHNPHCKNQWHLQPAGKRWPPRSVHDKSGRF